MHSVASVFANGSLIGTTTAGSNGVWAVAPAALADNVYSLTATATDFAGNTSAASAPFLTTIDTVAPAITFAPFTYQQGQPTLLSGTGEPNTSVVPTISGQMPMTPPLGVTGSGAGRPT